MGLRVVALHLLRHGEGAAVQGVGVDGRDAHGGAPAEHVEGRLVALHGSAAHGQGRRHARALNRGVLLRERARPGRHIAHVRGLTGLDHQLLGGGGLAGDLVGAGVLEGELRRCQLRAVALDRLGHREAPGLPRVGVRHRHRRNLVLHDRRRRRGVGGGDRVAFTLGRGVVLAQGAHRPRGKVRAAHGAAVHRDIKRALGALGVVAGVADLDGLARLRGVVARDTLGDREGAGVAGVGVGGGDGHGLVLGDGHRVLRQDRGHRVPVLGGRRGVLRDRAGDPGRDLRGGHGRPVTGDRQGSLHAAVAGVGEGVGAVGRPLRTALDRLGDGEGARVAGVGVREGRRRDRLSRVLDGDGLLRGSGERVAVESSGLGVLLHRARGALREGHPCLDGRPVTLGAHLPGLAVGAGVGEGEVLVASARSGLRADDALRDLEGAGRLDGVGGVVEGHLGRHSVADGHSVGRGSPDREDWLAPGISRRSRSGLAGVLGQGDDGALGEGALERVGLADTDVEDGRTAETVIVERPGGLPAGIAAGGAGQDVVDLDRQGRVRDVNGVQCRSAQGLEDLEAAEAGRHVHGHLERVGVAAGELAVSLGVVERGCVGVLHSGDGLAVLGGERRRVGDPVVGVGSEGARHLDRGDLPLDVHIQVEVSVLRIQVLACRSGQGHPGDAGFGGAVAQSEVPPVLVPIKGHTGAERVRDGDGLTGPTVRGDRTVALGQLLLDVVRTEVDLPRHGGGRRCDDRGDLGELEGRVAPCSGTLDAAGAGQTDAHLLAAVDGHIHRLGCRGLGDEEQRLTRTLEILESCRLEVLNLLVEGALHALLRQHARAHLGGCAVVGKAEGNGFRILQVLEIGADVDGERVSRVDGGLGGVPRVGQLGHVLRREAL